VLTAQRGEQVGDYADPKHLGFHIIAAIQTLALFADIIWGQAGSGPIFKSAAWLAFPRPAGQLSFAGIEKAL
jgi:hypothetical protein